MFWKDWHDVGFLNVELESKSRCSVGQFLQVSIQVAGGRGDGYVICEGSDIFDSKDFFEVDQERA